jgi:hypothetical protein
VDQQAETSRLAHGLRLAIAALGVVLGLLVLSWIFGASSASAATRDDDPGPAIGSLVTEIGEAAPIGAPLAHVAEPGLHVVQSAHVVQSVQSVAQQAPVAAIAQPVASVADDSAASVVTGVFGPEAADALGTGPVGAILSPLAGLVDDTLARTADVLTAPATTIGLLTDAAPAALTAVTSPAMTAVTALTGIATGVLEGSATVPGDGAATSVAAGGSPIPIAVLGGAFIALLAARRRLGADPGQPGAPVYETDSSPD